MDTGSGFEPDDNDQTALLAPRLAPDQIHNLQPPDLGLNFL